MEQWNRLLKRQILKYLGSEEVPADLLPLLEAINKTYNHYERDNQLIERAMDLSSAELYETNVELRKRNEELDRFVYSTSHDLRAPLTSIMGVLHVIELTDDPDRTKEYLKLISKSTEQLDNFIQDIVAYTHNKKAEFGHEKIDFQKLIHGSIDKLSFLPNSNSIQKNIFIQDGLLEFHSDYVRLENLFLNLISNSIKYHNPAAKQPFVTIRIEEENRAIKITIEDNGVGIKEQYVDRIFDMFFRASPASKGSGIGLYIVKEIVSKLSGKITVNSEYGKGTTFQILLPFVR